MNRKTGEYQDSLYGDEMVRAFVPYKLPPDGLHVDEKKLDAAVVGLDKLDYGGDIIVPSQDMFVYSFVRKEAIATSGIEGIQTTMADLLNFEPEAVDVKDHRSLDTMEACNYLDALEFAVQELDKPNGLPLSMRLLNNAHQRLMKGVRGKNKEPGKLRRVQNCLAGSGPKSSWFFPPPPSAVPGLLSDLENFIHGDKGLHPLVRTGLAHVQFETIHPYLDGNGRLGRLLIALLLKHWGLLDEPILYLSLYLKRHHSDYYRKLREVRTNGKWEEWMDFFLDGVIEAAKEAAELAKELSRIVSRDSERLYAQQSTTMPTMRLFKLLPQHPIITVKQASDKLGITLITASKAIDRLLAAKILIENTGKKSWRKYMYRAYVNALK